MTYSHMLVILFFTGLLQLIVIDGRRTIRTNSIQEFVKLVDDLNLNLSIIGTYRENSEEDGEDSVLSVKWRMPLNVKTTTNPTWNKRSQEHFLKSVDKYTKKAAKTREIVIENGKEKTVDENTVNSANIIDLPRYEHLIQNVDGEIKYEISSNGSYMTAFNYLLSNPSNDGEKNIQILDGTLSIKEVDISKDFPTDVLQEIKKLLPKLFFSIYDEELFARLLVIKLQNTFENHNFEVLVDVQNVAFGAKPFAKLAIGPTNLFVIIPPQIAMSEE